MGFGVGGIAMWTFVGWFEIGGDVMAIVWLKWPMAFEMVETIGHLRLD
jgi:hypothetical protein